MQCRHGGWDSVVHHHHIKVAGWQRGRNTDQVLGSKRITRRVRECLPIASEMSRDPTPSNNDCQETLNFQTDYPPGKNEIFIPPPPTPKPFSYGCDFHFVVPLENECWCWEGSGSTHSGTGRVPAGKNSQSRHKDKAPGCAGMALEQDNTLLCQIALGNIMEATMAAHL